MKLNKNYENLEQSYLFSTIARKVREYSEANPDKRIIRLGVGDVTKPLCKVVVDAMHKAVEEMGKDYIINEGDGAFYGPKIDFHLEDSIGRTWQCGTIQLDMQLPERFELEYTGADGQKHRPVMIHRVAYGSIERFIGILIEHFAGKFPAWLAPMQVKVLPITDRNNEYTDKLVDMLTAAGVKLTKIKLDHDRFSIIMSLCLSLIGLAVAYTCYGWGVYRLWQGVISYGTMTLFLQISGQLTASFSSLVSLVPSAISIATSAGRIMEITSFKTEKDAQREKALEIIKYYGKIISSFPFITRWTGKDTT